jgi:hypothetical protein
VASTDFLGVAGLGVGRIGRYFTVVSALPAAVFVSYLYLLIKAGAWSGPIRLSELAHFRIQDAAFLGIASLVLALAMNPLQFTLIQVFEGYWGTSAVGQRLALMRTAYHRHRLLMLRRDERDAVSHLADYRTVPPADRHTVEELIRHAIRSQESSRASASYPEDPARVLPTRLGNVLRRYETTVGTQYHLDLMASVPRLAMIAGEREVAYVENQRVQLELAIRTAFLSLIAAVATVVLLWRQGGWLLLALLPYAVAFFAYRGAVAVAHEYGMSLAVLVDLNRFRLYERLHVELPNDIDDERRLNDELMRLFAAKRNIRPVPYAHPASPEAAGATSSDASNAADDAAAAEGNGAG